MTDRLTLAADQLETLEPDAETPSERRRRACQEIVEMIDEVTSGYGTGVTSISLTDACHCLADVREKARILEALDGER